jgi:hypothetical protein
MRKGHQRGCREGTSTQPFKTRHTTQDGREAIVNYMNVLASKHGMDGEAMIERLGTLRGGIFQKSKIIESTPCIKSSWCI